MLTIKAERCYSAGIYLLKVNIRNTRTQCEICSKLEIKTPERCHWRRSGVFIVNFDHMSHLFLVFLLAILSKYLFTEHYGNLFSLRQKKKYSLEHSLEQLQSYQNL